MVKGHRGRTSARKLLSLDQNSIHILLENIGLLNVLCHGFLGLDQFQNLGIESLEYSSLLLQTLLIFASRATSGGSVVKSYSALHAYHPSNRCLVSTANSLLPSMISHSVSDIESHVYPSESSVESSSGVQIRLYDSLPRFRHHVRIGNFFDRSG